MFQGFPQKFGDHIQSIREFKLNFQQDEEGKTIAFIELYARISQQLDAYLSVFCDIINGENCLERANLIDFLKLISALDYFDFSSNFGVKIFEVLVLHWQSQSELDIVSTMLTNEALQKLYFGHLVECFLIDSEEPNFSMKLFYKVITNCILLLEGKIKGPSVSSNSIDNVLNQAMYMIRLKKRDFCNPKNHEIFLLTCSASLELQKRFAEKEADNLQVFHEIWQRDFENYKNLDFNVIDALFSLMAELCHFQQPFFFHQIQHQKWETLIMDCSAYLILSCENINKFWRNYLKYKCAMKFEDSKNHYMEIINFLMINMHSPTKNMGQLQKKINMVDNLIVLVEAMTNLNNFNFIMSKEKQILANPENNGLVCKFTSASFKVLYTPLYKVEEQTLFVNLFGQIQALKNYFQANYHPNKHLDCKEAIDLLPALKLILSKSTELLFIDQNLKNLLGFIFLFLDHREYAESFVGLFLFICDKFKKDCAKIKGQLPKNFEIYLNEIMLDCLSILQGYCLQSDSLKSYVKCIESLQQLLKFFGVSKPFVYSRKIVQVLKVREKIFEKQACLYLTKVFRNSAKSNEECLDCFHEIYSLIAEDNRHSYLELLFDFAQAHWQNQQIVEWMQSKMKQISLMCLTSPDKISQIRSLKYLVMLQTTRCKLNFSISINGQLQDIIENYKISLKLYHEIIYVVDKQIRLFGKLGRQKELNMSQIYLSYIDLLLNMILKMNSRLSHRYYSKTETAKPCRMIANLIFRLVSLFDENSVGENGRGTMNKIKQTLDFIKNANPEPMEKVVRSLIVSISYLQSCHGCKTIKAYQAPARCLQLAKVRFTNADLEKYFCEDYLETIQQAVNK